MSTRRVITHTDDDGKSTFIIDGTAPNRYDIPDLGGIACTMIWKTDKGPASNRGTADAADCDWHLVPPNGGGGSTFQIVDIPAGSDKKESNPAGAFQDAIGDDAHVDSDVHDQMHKTTTVDLHRHHGRRSDRCYGER